jgi:hypothetical protein
MMAVGVPVVVMVALLGSILWGALTTSYNPRLSKDSQRKLYYDLVSTQDINPDSQAWNQGVKEAAATYYNIPMSEVNNIIHEGTTNNWLTPHP